MVEQRNPIVFRNADGVRLAVAGFLSLLFHAAILAGDHLLHFSGPKRRVPEPLQATLVEPLPPPPELIAPKTPPQVAAKPERKTEPKPRSLPSQPAHSGFTAVEAVRLAQQQIARQLLYPEEAVARGLEGQATVRLFFDESGTAIAARLERSSGHTLLDDAAVRAANGVRLPAGTPSEIVLPVRFRLR
jgi:protein TonB